jgi:hypothetical protein
MNLMVLGNLRAIKNKSSSTLMSSFRELSGSNNPTQLIQRLRKGSKNSYPFLLHSTALKPCTIKTLRFPLADEIQRFLLFKTHGIDKIKKKKHKITAKTATRQSMPLNKDLKKFFMFFGINRFQEVGFVQTFEVMDMQSL